MAVTPAQKLRELLAQPNVEIMPGCYDALSAKLVADAGYKVTFMSGFAVSAARLGLPDTGLISFTEMLDSLRNCCAAAGKVPVIGDGDTGYGNALNVQRTVVEYARAGAACVMIEDQVSPKKCGHTRGKQVISREEARMKIRAAVDARADADILIMARTDARAVHRLRRGAGALQLFRGRGRRYHFLRSAGDRRRDAALLRGDDQALHGQHGAWRQNAGPAAGEAAGGRLQARALSGDAAVFRHHGDADHACGASPGPKRRSRRRSRSPICRAWSASPTTGARETQYQAKE